VFVNRVDELAQLRHWWEKNHRMCVVWGRRRVGKSALVEEFSRSLPTVFHVGARRPAAEELTLLSQLVHATVPDSIRDLLRQPYVNWDDALAHLGAVAEREPLLLVLDEFAELTESSPELPGVLRAFWDRAESRTKLRILLCGSAVRHMEAMQEYRAPLYGRFDLSLLVHPFQPHEAALLLPDLAPAERALVYGLLGGTPLYLSWWDQSADLRTNLLSLFGRPGNRGVAEAQLVLATEVERGGLPAAVLHAIAGGRNRYGQIKDLVRAEPARTLDRLIQLRLVERVVPVTEREDRSRRGFYRITDNFLAFYLQVVSNYYGQIQRGRGSAVISEMVNRLPDYMGSQWEEMFRWHLGRLVMEGQITQQFVDLGPWWNDSSNIEIDAVVLSGRSRVPVLAGEAKWTSTVDADRLLPILRSNAAAIPGANVDEMRFALCARNEVRGAPDDVLTITAADIMTP
jgi:hypothetical protein